MQAFSAQIGLHANRGGGLCKAGDILKEQHGDLLVSRHKVRQAEGVTLVRKKLGFATRPFVLCGLPFWRPSQADLLYERRNGFFTLQITGHPTLACHLDRTDSCRLFFGHWLSASRAKRSASNMRLEFA
jgi:hypothetical protein